MATKIKLPKLDLTSSTWDKSFWKPNLDLLVSTSAKKPETIAAIAKRVKFPFVVKKVAEAFPPPPNVTKFWKVGVTLTILAPYDDLRFIVAERHQSNTEGNMQCVTDTKSWEYMP